MSIRFFCLFVSWGRIVLLYNFLLELLLQNPIGFGLSYFHCHLFLEIFLISLLLSSVTCWLFRNVLFNLHVFVFLTVFSCNWYLVSQHCGQRRCLYDFKFLKFTVFWFVTQDVVYPGECSMCTWEEGVFFYIWMKCPKDINEIHLI